MFVVYFFLNLKGELINLKCECILNFKWNGMDGYLNYINLYWLKCKNGLRVEDISKMSIGDIIFCWINNEIMKSYEICVY